MKQTFTFLNQGPPSPALQIIFALRRGPLGFAGLRENDPSPLLWSMEGRRRLFLVWKEPIPRFAEIGVHLSYVGERIRVVKSEWVDPAHTQAILEPLASPDAQKDRARLVRFLARFFTVQPTSAADILAWRELRAGASHDKGFFNDLDRETWPDDTSVWSPIPFTDGSGIVPDAVRSAALDDLLRILQVGLRKRQLSTGTPASPYTALTGMDLQKLKAISAISVHCWNKHFSTQPPAVRLAFLRFATGYSMLLDGTDLPEPDPQILDWKSQACQPDSGFYFLFAELADLCIQSGVDAASWNLLFAALVHSQDLFWQCYRESTLKISFSAPVQKVAPFTPAVSEVSLGPDLTTFETNWSAQLQAVLWNYVSQFLSPVPPP